MSEEYDDSIIIHPSVVGWYDSMSDLIEDSSNREFVDYLLNEFFVPFISTLHHLGWDCEDEKFMKDFSAWIEVSKAVLYRRFNIHHPVQDGFDNIQ